MKGIKVFKEKAIRPLPADKFLRPEEVPALIETAKKGRNGERNALLIKLLYTTALRISEALQLKPSSIQYANGKPCVKVKCKGGKTRLVAIPESLVTELEAYGFRHKIGQNERFFPISRYQAFRIIRAIGLEGLNRRIYPHMLRHTGAIARLLKSKNPRALQLHLGHKSPLMTMRYLSTLAEEESLRINQEVEFEELF